MRRVRLGSGSTVNLIRLGFGRTVIASDEDLETLLDYDFEALPSRQIRIWKHRASRQIRILEHRALRQIRILKHPASRQIRIWKHRASYQIRIWRNCRRVGCAFGNTVRVGLRSTCIASD